MNKFALLFAALLSAGFLFGQKPKGSKNPKPAAPQLADPYLQAGEELRSVKFRSIGPFRGGRSVTACGVKGQPLVYYMGTTGGGLWKTENAGQTWNNISDGWFNTGSVGAVAVSESDVNVVYAGMGEHAPRGVMTSYGDGVYKSTDAGKTWKHMGLQETEQISWIRIHPSNPDIVYVAAQGQLHGPNSARGVYKSVNGGETWKKVLYVNDTTGCADLDIDISNPRILYAAMWNHQRLPWQVKSGGPGSGLYKSTDAGETWTRVERGLPADIGKMSVSISRANPSRVYALLESDWNKELGGLYISNDGGASFSQASKDHRLTQRAWYYVEVFADPQHENTVYVLNSPGLKSEDAGKTWTNIRGTHGDYHQLWINPDNNRNQIIANDGGAAVTFNGGGNWGVQNNQPTAQFYRVNNDHLWPYSLYGGQQDNTSVKIAAFNPAGYSIGEREWTYSAGGESAFLAFEPNHPMVVMGGSYQGTIEMLDLHAKEGKGVMVAPIQYQALQPKQMKYRFNWNAPIIHSMHQPGTFYHAGNILFKTENEGKTWTAVSPDLTRNDKSRQGTSGVPFTNEGAGGENYGTISYVAESKHEKGLMYAASDDGLVHITRDGGANWSNITPAGLPECLVNSIEVSPHDKATVYIAATRYKFNDKKPMLYKSSDYGKTWTSIVKGIPNGAYTRTVREDIRRKGLLFAGTETGLYVSWNDGEQWQQLQFGLPVTPVTDLKIYEGNLLAATMGRAFWILDDLHMLRTYQGGDAAKQLAVYKPNDVYRTSSGSILDGEYDPAAKDIGAYSVTAGVNAPSGAVIYYNLPSSFSDTLPLKLDVLTADGKVVRSYSSKAHPDFVSYPGGPEADPLLPATGGLHRFVWDLRYATLSGVPTVFIEGSYQGRKVAPGSYTIRLRAGNEVKETTVVVRNHPFVSAEPEDYAAQQEIQEKIEQDINDIHKAVLQMRKVRSQIETVNALVKNEDQYQEVAALGKSLVQQLQQWEDSLVQNKAKSNDDIINFVNMLSADYIFLHGEIDSNIPFVTDGQRQQYEVLHARWEHAAAQMRGLLQGPVASFNRLCAGKNISRVLVPGQ